MSLFLGLIIFISTASANICHLTWSSPSVSELKQVLETNEPVRVEQLFTANVSENAAMVRLLLLKPNQSFEVHITKDVYLEQAWLFNLLLVHNGVKLYVDGRPTGPYAPVSRGQQLRLELKYREYLNTLKISYKPDMDIRPYNQLLARLQSATP